MSAAAVLVTAMADFTALSQEDRQIRFVEKAQVNRVTFSEMGKLHVLISDDIAADNAAHPRRKPKTIYEELRQRGVSNSSISNASYGARIWRELVMPEHLTEAQYDGLTFQDCFAIARAMSSRSACQLDAPAVAELITTKPLTFDDEMASLYEHGVTVEEKTAQDERAAAQKLEAEIRARQAATPPPTASTPPAATGTPASATATGTPAATTSTAAASTTPAAQSEATSSDDTQEPETSEAGGEAEETGEAGPTNITPMPQAAAPADADLANMLDILDEIGRESAGYTPEGNAALVAKLDEVRAIIAARLEAPAEAVA